MSEQTMRANVVRNLKALDAFSVENPANPGTPDVNYIEGWIELKWLKRWPKAEQVKIYHFTPQQRVKLKKRWRKGGNAYLLLQVGREWLLFDGETAAQHVGRCSQNMLKFYCLKHFRSGMDWKELKKWLKR